jgi:ribosome-binding protein aMBF1 (putative translation factor)
MSNTHTSFENQFDEAEILKSFTSRLRLLRKENFWSFVALSKITKIHRTRLAKLESGQSAPTLIEIHQLRRAFRLEGELKVLD